MPSLTGVQEIPLQSVTLLGKELFLSHFKSQTDGLSPSPYFLHTSLFLPNDLHYYLLNMACVFLRNFTFAEVFLELGSYSTLQKSSVFKPELYIY